MPCIETLKFCDEQNQYKVPFVMYYDLEALLPHTEERAPNDLKNPYTIRIIKHVPCGWTVRFKFAYGEVADPEVSYRGKDCIKALYEHLTKDASRLYHMFPEKPMDPLSVKEQIAYMKSTRCHICFKKFNSKNPKVRDHCHYTGLYRGPAHRNCNLMFRIPSYIPVIAHNSAGYDTHLFVKELAKHFDDIGVVAKKQRGLHNIFS